MKKFLKVVLAGLMSFSMMLSMVIPAFAMGNEQDIINEMIRYYAAYQTKADTDIERLCQELSKIDKTKGEEWSKIMDYWKYVNDGMTVNLNVLPDGNPTDDSLCIVVLGFQLNPDGTMKDELIGRLQVALDSAKKYPNAYVACTGGGTASENPNATEADLMAAWLIEHGIDESRVIVENKSKTTVENAQFTYKMLRKSYPQIDTLCMVTSDYHVQRGSLLYNTRLILSAYEVGDKLLTITSNAGYPAGHESYEPLKHQARSLCQLIGENELGKQIYAQDFDIPTLSQLTDLELIGKESYKVGDDLDLKVIARYDSDYSKDITKDAIISGYDKTKSGQQTISVQYTENDITKTKDMIINVTDESSVNQPSKPTQTESKLIDLEVTGKESYKVGDDLDLKVVAKYDNGDSKDVTKNVIISGYDKTKSGQQTITLQYTEDGITKTKDMIINVTSETSKNQSSKAVKTGDTTDLYIQLGLFAMTLLGGIYLYRDKFSH